MIFSIYTTFASFVVLLAIHGSLQKSSPDSLTYRAAVVEFNPVLYRNDSARTLTENTMKMINYIERAAKKEVDIIIFPELIPTTFAHPPREYLRPWTIEIPDPSLNYAPCDSNDTSISDDLKLLGCAARMHKIYVAINTVERKNCMGKDCPADGVYYYVTSAAFDRNGTIISKYRKANVNEYGKYDASNLAEMVTFATDFGVTFSFIVCFDIYFQKPWINVARQLNVTDFIHQAAWFVSLPFRSPIQVPASWSYIEDVNLLSSGVNWVSEAYTGSGIYAGRQGILTATIALKDHEELLIADVPKKIKNITTPSIVHDHPNEECDRISNDDQGYKIVRKSFLKNNASFINVTNDPLDEFEAKLIARNGFVSEEFSHNGIRCKFDVNVTNLDPPATYRLVAFNGFLIFGEPVSVNLKICSIIFCTNDTLESCGRIHDSSTIFQSAAVTAIHVFHKNTTMAPTSLGTDMFPLRNWLFDQRKEQGNVYTTVFSRKPIEKLITFGIYGRSYDRDRHSSRLPH